tara:strand:+ start:525 stop:767 length:243 start_codon:yes stop_codon:yes gene_type:complete
MIKIKNIIIFTFKWIWNKLKTRYKITVSFNKEYGDSDDRVYLSKKIITQKEKHLKFRTLDKKLVEYRSAAGLNYIIEENE